MSRNRHKRGKKKGKNASSELVELKKALKNGEIDPLMWLIHFPGIRDTRVPTCRDCEDYKNGVCDGEYDPIKCFKEEGKHESGAVWFGPEELKPAFADAIKKEFRGL